MKGGDVYMSSLSPYIEMMERDCPYGSVRLQHRWPDSKPIGLSEIDIVPGETVEPATDCFVFGTLLSGKNVRLDVDFGDGRKTITSPVAGYQYLHPTASDIAYRFFTPHHLMLVSAPWPFLADLLERDARTLKGQLSALHEMTLRDETLRETALTLWRMAGRDGVGAGLLLEHGLAFIAGLLADRVKGVSAPRTDQAGGTLTAAEVRLLDEEIDASSDGAISVQGLANAVGVGPSTLNKALRATCGLTPYQYVLNRRIERARHYLSSGTLSIVEIALDCGFSSQSHMTDVFTQKLGMTPGRYRKECLGRDTSKGSPIDQLPQHLEGKRMIPPGDGNEPSRPRGSRAAVSDCGEPRRGGLEH